MQTVNGNPIKSTPQKRIYAGEYFDVNGVMTRGWADLEGTENTPSTGGTAPNRNTYQTGVSSNSYDINDTFDLSYHLTHNEAKNGTNLKYFHIHAGISEGSTASGSNLVVSVTLGYSKLYAAGRDMTAITPITKTLTATPAELNAAAGNHILMGNDTLIAQNGGGAGLWDVTDSGLNTEIWLPDDLILVSCTVTSVPTITGGLSQRVFIFRRDIHREVLIGGSPERVYDFWG